MATILKEIIKKAYSKKLLLVMITSLATAIGSMSGFPVPPQTFIDLTQKYEIIQWALMYILILQGGSGFDMIFAAFATFLVFVLYKTVIYFEKKNSVKNIIQKVDDIVEDVKGIGESVVNKAREFVKNVV